MTKKEYIANLNSFITHFQDMIKDYDKGKIHPSFDREQAEKDIETFNAAIKAIEQEPRWIPISDKCLVAVSCTSRNDICDSFTAYFDGKHFYRHLYDRTIISGVKAWMPLPTSYKPQESEVGIEIVKTKEVEENGIKYLNINVSNSEVERNPDIVRLYSDAGMLEYVKPKTGHWKRNETIRLTYCSECGFGQHIDEFRTYNYCPNCGVRMEVSE